MTAIEYYKIIFPNSNPSESQFDLETFPQRKVDSYNATVGNLTGYDCPKCRNRGKIAFLREDNTMGFWICPCMTTRACIQQMENSGLKNFMQDYTFDKYLVCNEAQRQAKALAMDYAANPQGWFSACGQSGFGKTHLLCAISRALLLRGQGVYYFPWREKIPILKDPEHPEHSALMEKIQSVPTLFLDDLFKTGAGPDGTMRPTSADISHAYAIINGRYVSGKNCIISTELSPRELIQIDEAVAGRILERSGSNLLDIKKDVRKNYRLREYFRA